MEKGINMAKKSIQPIKEFADAVQKSKPCIFLSHISLDNDIVVKIGEYIKKAGINIYLDIDDPELQQAVKDRNDLTITKYVEQGILNSTHILCVLTEHTKESWWVPYEIGFGKNAGKVLLTMPFKNVPPNKLPSYIKITEHLTGINSLNKYIQRIFQDYLKAQPKSFTKFQEHSYNISSEASILEESVSYHPLKDYLNQN
ncbi:hypothetical protein D3C75_423830 [compost metagenome]